MLAYIICTHIHRYINWTGFLDIRCIHVQGVPKRMLLTPRWAHCSSESPYPTISAHTLKCIYVHLLNIDSCMLGSWEFPANIILNNMIIMKTQIAISLTNFNVDLQLEKYLPSNRPNIILNSEDSTYATRIENFARFFFQMCGLTFAFVGKIKLLNTKSQMRWKNSSYTEKTRVL